MTTESKRQRTFVLRVSEGRSIVHALLELARAREVALGHVSGFGVLRTATLDLPAADGGRTDAYFLEGPFELLAVSGKVIDGDGSPAVELAVQLARATDAGLSCVGGRILDAAAEDVELMIVALDETVQKRAPEHAAPSSREVSPAPMGWAAVAAASEAADSTPPQRSRAAPGRAGEGVVPARGEFIDHKVFGICRVEAVKPDGTMIIKLETGRRKQLKLDALEILAPKTGGSRVIYPVQMRRS